MNSPIVFIPGLFCDERLWQPQVSAFQKQTKTIIADITTYNSLETSAHALLQKLPEKFCLVGFSLGGLTAMKIMEIAPERVQKLALLSCTDGRIPPMAIPRIEQWVKKLDATNIDEYLAHNYPTYFHPNSKNILRELYFDMAKTVGIEAGVRQMHALLSRRDSFTHLSQIHCPTIVLGGKEDQRISNETFITLAQSIPNAALFFIENSGHFITLEQHEIVNDLLLNWYEH